MADEGYQGAIGKLDVDEGNDTLYCWDDETGEVVELICVGASDLSAEQYGEFVRSLAARWNATLDCPDLPAGSVAQALAVLRWYADPANLRADAFTGVAPYDQDNGDRARVALAAAGLGEREEEEGERKG